MNKYILKALVAGASVAFMASCGENSWNDHYLDGFDSGVNYDKSVKGSYTLTEDDYETISKQLEAEAPDSLKAEAKAIASNKFFNKSGAYPAQTAVLALLDTRDFPYYYAPDGSSVDVTFSEAGALPEELTAIAGAQTLTVSTEDYQKVWGSETAFIKAFAPDASAAEYTMDGTDVYQESDSYRTLDNEQNMVRIGEEMTAVFEAAGIGVIHDTTLYDYPSYNNAYIRSIEGVQAALKEYPSLVLLLDVHRDALVADDGTIYKAVAGTVDNCAQVMMVMGSDASGQIHPNWKVNLALAAEIQDAVAQKWATLARPIVLRTSRFNQHVSTGAILVEVGTHGNTLQEAITAARLYARTVAELMTG